VFKGKYGKEESIGKQKLEWHLRVRHRRACCFDRFLLALHKTF
jgi:hypothetical protein